MWAFVEPRYATKPILANTSWFPSKLPGNTKDFRRTPILAARSWHAFSSARASSGGQFRFEKSVWLKEWQPISFRPGDERSLSIRSGAYHAESSLKDVHGSCWYQSPVSKLQLRFE